MGSCRLLLIASVSLAAAIIAVFASLIPWQLAVILGIVVLVNATRRTRILDAFGTASWATADQLERAGMLGGSGLCVGVINKPRPSFWGALRGLFDRSKPAAQACEDFVFSMRKLQRYRKTVSVCLNRVVHTIVIAPTGAGKGVSLIIPFLLRCTESCVVIDPKSENAKITGAARKAMGHQVVIIAPFSGEESDSFNPLDAIDTKSPLALDDCRAVANQIVKRTGTESDPHWNDKAEEMITALIAVTLFLPSEQRSLQTVRQLLTNTELRNQLLKGMSAVGDWGGMLARVCHGALDLKDKELSGVISTANRHMNFLDSVPVAKSTSTSSFDPADLFKKKMTVYLVLPPEYLDSHAGLLRMWVGGLMRACIRNGLQEKDRVHFVLDEAASLGKLDILKHAVDKLRSFGVRLQFYFQSRGQITEIWQNGGDQTLLSNTTQVYFAVRDQTTAESLSATLGKGTILIESSGTNRGTSTSANRQDANGSFSTSSGSNVNHQQHGRELLTSSELMTLSERLAITLTPGVPPIVTHLTRYYEESQRGNGRWKRLQMKVEIWTAAVSLLALLGTLGWCMATILLSPQGR